MAWSSFGCVSRPPFGRSCRWTCRGTTGCVCRRQAFYGGAPLLSVVDCERGGSNRHGRATITSPCLGLTNDVGVRRRMASSAAHSSWRATTSCWSPSASTRAASAATRCTASATPRWCRSLRRRRRCRLSFAYVASQLRTADPGTAAMRTQHSMRAASMSCI